MIRMISSFTVLIEKEQSEGRVDCIIEIPMFVYIFEFKRDGSATEALKQIEEKDMPVSMLQTTERFT